MLFSLLQSPILLIPVMAAIIVAFTVHEFSHALAAELLGDETPKNLGRLTLNPMSHVHWLGFVLLLVAGFGWGKPVPFNPNRLKNAKWGSAIIGMAGPFSNLVMAIISVLAITILNNTIGISPDSLLAVFLVFLYQFNMILMIFNLIPVPPLDGSKLLFALVPDKYAGFKQSLATNGPMILIMLIILDTFLPVSIFGTLFSFILGGVNKFLF
jgi:Zn-dependent protease